MPHETLAQLEYEALRAEERDRMNGRTQVWTLYLTVVAAFGFATLQSGMSTYIVTLCPLVLACLARHSRHSEDVLKQVRKYLYQMEIQSEYRGYEHFTRTESRQTHGGYRTALRDAFLLTDLLAEALVLWRMYTDHVSLWLCLLVFLVGGAAMVAAWRWLSRPTKKRA